MKAHEQTGPLWDLREAENCDPDRVVLRWRNGAWTVGQFANAARSVAIELADLGVSPGDRVAIMAGNSARALAVTFGTWLAGGVEVAVNAELRGALLHHVLTDADPVVLIASSDLLTTAQGQRPELQAIRIENIDLDRTLRVDDPAVDYPLASDLASLLYTSGTTGPSKGVMVPHGYFSHHASAMGRVLRLTSGDACYFTLPFSHVDAHIAMPTNLKFGSILSFAERFSVSRFWDDVEHFRATWFGAVGSMLSALATRQAPNDQVVQRLRVILAAPVPEDAYAYFEDTLNIPLLQMYGQTEVNGPIYSTFEARRRGAMGQAHEDFEIRVVGPDGMPLPARSVGRLQVRSLRENALALGYWRRPEATAATFGDAWFTTGDLAWRDENGFWWYAGRATDSVRKRGENVSAFEVESVLKTARGVREAAIIAVRDELGGEDDIKAVLVTDEAFRVEIFVAHCCEHLPRFARPRYVDTVQEEQLVRGPGTGSIQKHLLPQGVSVETIDLNSIPVE